MEADMLCCGYTLLYTMGMERRMTKKEEEPENAAGRGQENHTGRTAKR